MFVHQRLLALELEKEETCPQKVKIAARCSEKGPFFHVCTHVKLVTVSPIKVCRNECQGWLKKQLNLATPTFVAIS